MGISSQRHGPAEVITIDNPEAFNAITHAHRQTVLPVIFDPSHVSGDHRIVPENLMASVAHFVDGTITETLHDEAFRAEQLCDAAQAIHMDTYAEIVEAVLTYEEKVEPVMRRILRSLEEP